jgi:putative lipase involved disintegration of autophagic bodies
MVSTHRELLAMFEQMEVSYMVIIPPITDKEIYLHRYDMRGNSYDFIRQLDTNWQQWISGIIEKPTVLKTVVVLPKDGCIKAFADKFGKENR